MELSVREVATLLDRSVRTVRAQVARGVLPGRKVNGQWRMLRQDLPLTDSQRASLQAKADRVRRAVEETLPSRAATSLGDRRRSLADLDLFAMGSRLLAEIRGAEQDEPANGVHQRTGRLLERALMAVAVGSQQYDRRLKLTAFNRARGCFAGALALLLMNLGEAPKEATIRWIANLENKIMPSLAGLARWTESLGKHH